MKKVKEKSADKSLLKTKWRLKMHEVIFEAETPAGKWFDILLLWVIIFSIIIVMLESVSSINMLLGRYLRVLEWSFTILFSIEYLCRILSASRTAKYIFSFFGIIDLLAILPTYIAFFIGGMQYLLVVRSFRLLRVFRIFKLTRFLREGSVLVEALKASRYKIILFLGVVFSIVIIMGTVMYVIEGVDNGFTSIPRSIYWAIVTLTTVGYGDIAPRTVLGQSISSLIMILGYAIIAVPTGIVTVELSNASRYGAGICRHCGLEKHEGDARFCKQCGTKLSPR